MGRLCDGCDACGRYKKQDQEWWPVFRTDNWDGENRLDILVVTNGPELADYEAGHIGSHPAYNWVLDCLKQFPNSYLMRPALLCHAPTKPTAKQVLACATLEDANGVANYVRKYKPRVIFTLGDLATKAVLQSAMTLSDLMKLGIAYEPVLDTPVIIMESPRKHSQWTSPNDGGYDMRPTLQGCLQQLAMVLAGKIKKPEPPEYFLVEKPEELDEALKMQENWGMAVGFDTEAGIQPGVNIAEQSERVKFLTYTVSGRTMDTHEKQTIVVDCPEWSRKQQYFSLHQLLKRRIAIMTWAFIDINVVWWQCGYNMFAPGGVMGFHDLHLLSWAQNQLAYDNGLEAQASRLLGVPNWKHEQDELEARAMALITPKEGLVHDWRHRYEVDRMKFLDYQARDGVNTADLWFEHYSQDGFEPAPQFDLRSYRISRDAQESYSWLSRRGFPISKPALETYFETNHEKYEEFMGWLRAHPITMAALDKDINVKSPPQMSKLCRWLGVKTRQVTEKLREPKVDQDELERQSHSSVYEGVVKRNLPDGLTARQRATSDYFYAILQARIYSDKVSKNMGFDEYSYEQQDLVDNNGNPLALMHPFFKVGRLAGARGGDGGIDSGRISSVMHSVGNATKEKLLRKAFRARKGYKIVEVDLSAIEPRMFAYVAGERSWIEVFELQADPATRDDPANDLYRRDWATFQQQLGFSDFTAAMVSDEERQRSKILDLRLCYDSSPQGITRDSGIPLEETMAYATAFWRNKPAFQKFAWEVRKKILFGDGWLESVSGRRGRFVLYNRYVASADDYAKLSQMTLWELCAELGISEADAHTMRKGMNFLIQGPSGDIVTTALKHLLQEIDQRRIAHLIYPFNAVHDSIWAEVREDWEEEGIRMLARIMCDPARMWADGIHAPFPQTGRNVILCSAASGYNMGEMQKVKVPCD